MLGVPFLLALLGRGEVVTTAALSLLASLGDLMVPAALAATLAAKVTGVSDRRQVLRLCIVPAVVDRLSGGARPRLLVCDSRGCSREPAEPERVVIHVYQAICALIAVLVIVAVLRARTLGEQVTGALVLVPLLLRVFLVK